MSKTAVVNLIVLLYFQSAQGALLELPKVPLFLYDETPCEASLSEIAQNSNLLNQNTRIFRASFYSPLWYGNLYAYGISPEGIIHSSPFWNAGCKLTGGACANPLQTASENIGKAPTDRVIITRAWDGTNTGVPFRWPERYQDIVGASENLAALLTQAPFSFNTSVAAEINENQRYGQALLNYLRGDRSNERQNSGIYQFRDRVSILGDIVHSNVVFVQSHSYTDNIETVPYSTFKQSNTSRTPMVAVGANDGMLHIFNANNGEELLAFVPGNHQIYKKLPLLSNEDYSHEYFVDGGVTVNDVFINGAWRTILVGSYRNGAQGIYALDITNPNSFSEENADNIYLWEFSDKDDADIGYVYGKPVIAKVNSPSGEAKWAVIFGNGYNNSEPDGNASVTGKGYLFILFIELGLDEKWDEGQNYIKIPVPGGSSSSPNGISSAYPVVLNNNSTNSAASYILDYVYAGDLQGHLWRFDVNTVEWSANSVFFSGKPITSAPVVGPHLGGEKGVMVYFGTGKYLEENDARNNPPTQTFYGIWDQLGDQQIDKNNLLEQEISESVVLDIDYDGDGLIDAEATVRVTSNHPINWSTAISPQHQGWRLNLTPGEQVIYSPTLKNGVITFTTNIFSSMSCAKNHRSWLMTLNANNGGRLSAPFFDFNRDGVLSVADYVDQTIPPSGMLIEDLLTGPPLHFIMEGNWGINILNGASGMQSIKAFPYAAGVTGRQSWKSL